LDAGLSPVVKAQVAARVNSKVTGGLADRDAEAARTQKMANAITGCDPRSSRSVKDVQSQSAPQAGPANQKASQPKSAPKAQLERHGTDQQRPRRQRCRIQRDFHADSTGSKPG